ncbi:hypothetical protein E2986_13747 [Frieseomelitta varia]|uniref:Uncharacterized protein n=1 Tax=Frieseomelitta varia TaxID=561572 RepID=A0A833S2X0_9HYME|nr:hypothetical protein E2986_13747 [Frieseomelitta varia]
MGASLLPILFFTFLWGIVGIVLPIFVPKGTNRGWLCCYMAQMNPLIGPKLSKFTILMMAREWSQVQFDSTVE